MSAISFLVHISTRIRSHSEFLNTFHCTIFLKFNNFHLQGCFVSRDALDQEGNKWVNLGAPRNWSKNEQFKYLWQIPKQIIHLWLSYSVSCTLCCILIVLQTEIYVPESFPFNISFTCNLRIIMFLKKLKNMKDFSGWEEGELKKGCNFFTNPGRQMSWVRHRPREHPGRLRKRSSRVFPSCLRAG